MIGVIHKDRDRYESDEWSDKLNTAETKKLKAKVESLNQTIAALQQQVANLKVGEGVKGDRGEPGVGIKDAAINDRDQLVLTLTDDRRIVAGTVKGGGQGLPGKPGEKGDAGRGIESVEMDKGNLVLKLTDGTKKQFPVSVNVVFTDEQSNELKSYRDVTAGSTILQPVRTVLSKGK